MKTPLIALFVAAAALPVRGQVTVTTEQSPDKSSSSSQVAVSAGDHTFVPLTVETQKNTVDANTTRSESTTRALKSDGSYFDWRTTTTEAQKVSPSTTEKTSEVVEKDRQGNVRVTKSSTERVVKSPDGGQQDTAIQYRRDNGGRLVVDSQSTAVSKPNADGSISTTRTESRADSSGALSVVQRVDETTVKLSDAETKTDKTIQTVNHLDGGFSPSARESVIVKNDGSSTTTETVVQKPANGSWQTQARTVTTEQRAPDGTIERETIEQERPTYAQGDHGAGSNAVLEPKQKTIEREVRQPDGSVVTERQVLHHDINGDWKPDSFSTDAADKAY